MKRMSRILIAAFAVAVVAVAAFAQLSAKYADFAKGPEQYIMTPQEQAQWKQVKTDAEAQKFIDLFWARRDPTPGTPVNEYRDNFEAAVKYADEHFKEGRRAGSLTDRGRVLELLGAPSRIERSGNAASSIMAGTETNTSGGDQQTPRQIWVYDPTKIPAGVPVRIPFADQFGSGAWNLERGGGIDMADVTRRVLAASIISPNLTEVPKPAVPATERQPQLPTTPAAPPTTASIGAFKTPALQTAVENFKPNQFRNADITYTEMLSPSGEYFVPAQLYIPKSAGLTADQVTTFFGRVVDATNTPVAIFEEPAALSTSGGDLYFDRSISTLKPGAYTAVLGLADKAGNPVVLISTPLELKGLTKDETSVSRLVLSGDVHQTDVAAPPGAPYAFGRVKMVPKGDHVFTNRDEVTYFVEVVNPGIDVATNMPKVQVKLELAGTGTKEKPARTITAPIADATPLPLTGVPGPGQYAIMAGIPLGEMKNPLPPGDYTLRVKVYDQVSKKSWTVEQPLKLVAGPAAAPATTTSK
jgi:GWxTD domain-containing protein